MAEIVNLKRAKKAKARAESEKNAAHNRARFGASKKTRDLAKSRVEKNAHTLDEHKLDDD